MSWQRKTPWVFGRVQGVGTIAVVAVDSVSRQIIFRRIPNAIFTDSIERALAIGPEEDGRLDDLLIFGELGWFHPESIEAIPASP
jgi:hypothetical protein